MTNMVMDFSLKIFLVWESQQWERHLVLKKIAEHVLSRHLSLSKENIVVVVDQLDFSLAHGAVGNDLSYSPFFNPLMVHIINICYAFENLID